MLKNPDFYVDFSTYADGAISGANALATSGHSMGVAGSVSPTISNGSLSMPEPNGGTDGNLLVDCYDDLYYLAAEYSLVTPDQVFSAASWAAGTVTFDTAKNHGLNTNDVIDLEGFTPSGYNKANAVVTVVDANTFTVAIAANPGAWDGSSGRFNPIGQPWMVLMATPRLNYGNQNDYVHFGTLSRTDYLFATRELLGTPPSTRRPTIIPITNWSGNLKLDTSGATRYTAAVTYLGNQATLSLPDGTTRIVTDYRVGRIGKRCFNLQMKSMRNQGNSKICVHKLWGKTRGRLLAP